MLTSTKQKKVRVGAMPPPAPIPPPAPPPTKESIFVRDVRVGSAVEIGPGLGELYENWGWSPIQRTVVGTLGDAQEDMYEARKQFWLLPESDKAVPLQRLRLHKSSNIQLLVGDRAKEVEAKRRKVMEANLGDSPFHLNKGVRIGTDPECFVVDEANKVIPAFTFLGAKRGGNYTPFWDGFQSEFTTESTECLEYQTDNVLNGLHLLYEKAIKHNPLARLTPISTFKIDDEVLASAKPQHIALGCAPSLNAYGREKMCVDNPLELKYRSAGCHLHIGFKGSDGSYSLVSDDLAIEGVKTIDALCGIAFVGAFGSFDHPARRMFYGRAGEYRMPKYGVEYRTLSSMLLCHPSIFHLGFDLGRFAWKIGAANNRWLVKGSEQEIEGIINECDVKAAREVVKRNEGLYQAVFTRIYGAADPYWTVAKQIFLEGVESFVKDPLDMKTNWGLDKGYKIKERGMSFRFGNPAYHFAKEKKLIGYTPDEAEKRG